ncbi:MAG: hypothetical protein HY054_07465 [Proteobacteria bacterium]|nr:hypothetical protein [Pseudomonadota bacterium]
MLRARVLLLATLAIFAAAQPVYADDQSPPLSDSAADWSSTVRNAIDQDPRLVRLSPTDIADFCPGYDRLSEADRRTFWANLMVEIARAESGGEADRTHFLLFDGAVRRPAFRRGLFQISIEAARSSRFNCAVPDGRGLLDPGINAACAIHVVENTIGARDQVSAAGDYWPSLAARARRARIAAITAGQSPCQPAPSR